MLAAQDRHRPTTPDALLGAALAARLDALDVLSRKVLSGALPGERRSKRRGRSVEFDDFRPYTLGDDPRHIDWNAYARFDRLVLKLFREEEDLALHILVDASASMDAGEPGKLVFAGRLALALAYLGLVNQNRVSIAAFGREAWPQGLRALAPRRGRSAVRHVGGFLLDVLNDTSRLGPGAPAFARVMRTQAARGSPRGIVLVISDFFMPDVAEGLAALSPGTAAGTLDAYALQVRSPGEADPARESPRGLVGDLRLTDIETGRGCEVTISDGSLRDYAAAHAKAQDELRRACLSRGVAFVPLQSDESIDAILTSTLRRGGLVHSR